ncbi:MAG: flagellar basal body P-ring formation chaperone FlgA, partial [Rhodothalassiaceae bacterium]
MSLRLLLLVTLFGAIAAPVQGAAVLRTHVEVRDAVIRLGDLVTGAGAAADRIIAAAPPPGESMTLSGHDILSRAREAGLGIETGGIGFVKVARVGRAISEETLRARIAAALAEHGATPPLRLRITNHSGPLYVAVDADPAAIRFDSVDYDRRSGRFSVTLALPADGGLARREVLSGVAEAERKVPVLARALGPGDVITARDIDWLQIPVRRINRTMISDETQLLGREPVRPLRPGVPLRLSEVRAPLLIHKGAIVTMIVQRGGL